MSDRKAFLETIRTRPKCNTSRMAYADWLDDNGDRGDLDTATAEFIRVSCAVGKRTDRMPKAAYHWIGENWRRLLPTVFAKYPYGVFYRTEEPPDHTGMRDSTTYLAEHWRPYRDGRNILAGFCAHDTARVFFYSVSFSFFCGFAESFGTHSTTPDKQLRKLVCVDQPFVSPPFKDVPLRPLATPFPVAGGQMMPDGIELVMGRE